MWAPFDTLEDSQFCSSVAALSTHEVPSVSSVTPVGVSLQDIATQISSAVTDALVAFPTLQGKRKRRYKDSGIKDDRLFRNPGKLSPLLLPQETHEVQLSPTFGANGDCTIEEINTLGSPISTVPTCVDDANGIKDRVTDGFAEMFSVDEEENPPTSACNLSSSMAALLSGPLLNQDIEVSNVSMNRSRLYRSPSMPERLDRPMLKRPVRPQDNETPVRIKRRRSTNSPLQPDAEETAKTRRMGGTPLKKTLSLCDVDISQVLDEDCGHRHLIGDFTKVFALPTVMGRHQDLRYITSETLSALIHGEFNSLVERFYIIDCRYPYEYEGGHIRGALNLDKQEEVLDYFLKTPLVPSVVQKRIILIFHCEFSSERGPKMCRFLREEDRARNEYPSLHYPELYLLKGGYKEFFPEYKELCEPQGYCPMHHQDFREELLKCRTKCKSWVGERKRMDQISRLMKL
ncbi:M-phase inducer phosphatase 1-B-like [Bombina bombina]|uniref:M-phase inducer phosphatase 1-B-like n=1 Tax=Bombina bombina TaxID=8345 RepID=UPI00235A651F|nr:M-phase inducer phosphatase 1-B-like [Bombina bombina]